MVPKSTKKVPRVQGVLKTRSQDHPWNPKLEPKIDQKSFRRGSENRSYFSLVLVLGFGAIWCQLGSNLNPKPSPNPPKLGPEPASKLYQESNQFLAWLLIALNTFLVNVASKLEAGIVKILMVFIVFAMPANLPTRGHMIDFLAN